MAIIIKFTARPCHRAFFIILTAGLALSGCGGGTLVPRDLKDYIAADLKTPRRNVEFTQPFRSSIILRVQTRDIESAHQAERDLIQSAVEYFQRDNIRNFINDTIVFVVRLDTDPDVNLKYFTVAADLRELVGERLSLEDFIERCRREENWEMEEIYDE